KRQQRRKERLLSRNYESRDPFDEPYKKFRTQYAQRLHNTFATMQIKLNLPLNTVNSKKSRMPNVANRVDAIVMFRPTTTDQLPKRTLHKIQVLHTYFVWYRTLLYEVALLDN
ncbi:hypothetical protein, partial [Aliivibrio finisterrensis]|uniref:hypothetical protein n=2 Tax=Aliivibrio finisterrensis TaxID=511998 RepID=UPI001A916BE2